MITHAAIPAIRSRLRDPAETYRGIAHDYGVAPMAIRRIAKGIFERRRLDDAEDLTPLRQARFIPPGYAPLLRREEIPAIRARLRDPRETYGTIARDYATRAATIRLIASGRGQYALRHDREDLTHLRARRLLKRSRAMARRSPLRADDVRRIRARLRDPRETYAGIARDYSVPPATIKRIAHGTGHLYALGYDREDLAPLRRRRHSTRSLLYLDNTT